MQNAKQATPAGSPAMISLRLAEAASDCLGYVRHLHLFGDLGSEFDDLAIVGQRIVEPDQQPRRFGVRPIGEDRAQWNLPDFLSVGCVAPAGGSSSRWAYSAARSTMVRWGPSLRRVKPAFSAARRIVRGWTPIALAMLVMDTKSVMVNTHMVRVFPVPRATAGAMARPGGCRSTLGT
jgi:hypothetical protein